MKRPNLCAWALVMVFFAMEAGAAEVEHLFESTRARGRGRTFVAAFDSNEATRFNPATLAEPKLAFQMRWFGLDAFAGQNTLGTISDLTNISSKDEPVDVLRKFDDKFGERQSVRGQLELLAMRFGAFEFSPFAVNSTWLELRSPVMPYAEWRSDSYAGVGLSYALALGKSFFVGATIRPMERFYFAGSMQFADMLDFLPPSEAKFEDYAKMRKGSGVGVDIGTIWMPTKQFRWGLVVQNVGDTGFGKGADAPPPLPQEIHTGMLYRMMLSAWDLDLSMDIQNLLNREGINWLRHANFGSELGYRMFSRDHDIGITAGVSEGYIGAGVFMNLWAIRFEMSQYTVELEQNPGQRQDKRLTLAAKTAMTF